MMSIVTGETITTPDNPSAQGLEGCVKRLGHAGVLPCADSVDNDKGTPKIQSFVSIAGPPFLCLFVHASAPHLLPQGCHSALLSHGCYRLLTTQPIDVGAEA